MAALVGVTGALANVAYHVVNELMKRIVLSEGGELAGIAVGLPM